MEKARKSCSNHAFISRGVAYLFQTKKRENE